MPRAHLLRFWFNWFGVKPSFVLFFLFSLRWDITMLPRLASNLLSCFSLLLSTGIIGMDHHAWPGVYKSFPVTLMCSRIWEPLLWNYNYEYQILCPIITLENYLVIESSS
jgi:hypothetical protein